MPESIPALLKQAEAELGPVSILVNNASGWVADSFVPAATNRFGLAQALVHARARSTRCSRSTPAPLPS